MRIAFLILALSGCGYKTYNLDPGLQPIVAKFEALIDKKIEFSITIVDIDLKWDGVCYINSDGSREIQLSAHWWPEMSDDEREETLFHELGHCELGRGHVNDLVNNVPVSIMYPYMFGAEPYYAANRQAYIDELIQNRVYVYEMITNDKFDDDFIRR